jgi:predicted metal-binding membrane protein
MDVSILARAAPITAGVVVVIAGVLQFTASKAHHLACCRMTPREGGTLPADANTAWRHGLRLGLHCTYCCAGLTVILLVIGVMGLRAMAVVTAAITANVSRPPVSKSHEASGQPPLGQGCF